MHVLYIYAQINISYYYHSEDKIKGSHNYELDTRLFEEKKEDTEGIYDTNIHCDCKEEGGHITGRLVIEEDALCENIGGSYTYTFMYVYIHFSFECVVYILT